MPTAKTHGKQMPYGIEGTVTLNGSAYEGAKIWIRDVTEGTVPAPVDDYTVVYTNNLGKYTINLAQSTDAYSNADSVRVYCQVGDILSYSDITINTGKGYTAANFTIVKKAGTVDGCKGTPLDSGKGGLNRELTRGCSDGLT